MKFVYFQINCLFPRLGEGEHLECYSHNGYVYDLKCGKYLIVAYTAENQPTENGKKCVFMLRTLKDGVKLNLL